MVKNYIVWKNGICRGHRMYNISINGVYGVRGRNSAYIVLEAKFVSSCFSCPSSANPRLSLLFVNSGLTINTLDCVNPGPIGLSLR